MCYYLTLLGFFSCKYLPTTCSDFPSAYLQAVKFGAKCFCEELGGGLHQRCVDFVPTFGEEVIQEWSALQIA